jgi:hypothetical protein
MTITAVPAMTAHSAMPLVAGSQVIPVGHSGRRRITLRVPLQILLNRLFAG